MAYVCSCSQYLMAQAAPLGPEPWRRHWSAAAACLRQASSGFLGPRAERCAKAAATAWMCWAPSDRCIT